MKLKISMGLVGLCAALPAAAENLAQVYDRALQVDPTMQEANFTHLAVRENRTQALLNMLPLNASASKNWSGISGQGSVNSDALGTVDLSVNLFSWDNWVALKAANSTVAQGEANYVAAQEDLVQRVCTLYFNVLNSQDQLNAQLSALASVQRQLEQAERRYEVGLIAITDVQSARASRDSTSAQVIAARRTLASSHEQLRAVTGEKYEELDGPGENMPLLTPDPSSEDAWVTSALSQNAALIASRLSADISHDNYLTAIGGHLPTITATASRSWDLQHPNQNQTSTGTGIGSQIGQVVNTQDIVWSVGVSVPIFSAGATQSRVRQARYQWKAAQADLERTSRSTEQQARDAYQGVISQIAQVQALKQAVQSNQVALQATEAGYDVGTKTALDVLTARQNLVTAESNYSSAKYSYLYNIVSLRLAAGTLNRKTIDEINSWLQEQVAVPTTTPPAPNGPPDTSPAGEPATATPATTPATQPVAPTPAPAPATP
ncbi:MAG TPA: TolC family outer membrane protein [Steroidobacteraceae bacterium]|nr:TolC family outer membrane protein [Steroidobacteraceae bacterium]